nr:hypothetical protein [Tanacetum cinerariifolium]
YLDISNSVVIIPAKVTTVVSFSPTAIFFPLLHTSKIRMARLQFCDYHNMVAILEKGEFNTDFHLMVDFIVASPLRRNLKLRDEDGIVSIPDTELFENLTLMGFNEFSSNIATALVCLATNRIYNFSKMIFDAMVKNVNNKISKFLMYPRFLTICLRMSQFGQITHTHQYMVPFHTKKLFTTLRVNIPSFSGRIVPLFDTMLVHQGHGSGTPTEPHHTPTPEADTSHPTTSSIPFPSLSTALIPSVTQTDTTTIRQYSKRARIAQSSALLTVVDEPASPVRDVSEGEACPTKSGFIADQDRATIAKSSTLPYDSAPRVTSPAADEGILEDRDCVAATHSGDDAPIKGRSINEGEAVAERISNDSKEIARVLTFIDAATVLAGGIHVPTGSGSIPTAGPPAADISTGSKVAPTASPIVIASLIVSSYSKRKDKEVMVESDTPKKQKLQEQIDAQVSRELEEQQEKEDMKMNEQIARDAEVARIHAKEELQESTEKANDQEAEEGILYGYDQKQLRVEGLKEEAKRLKRKGLNLEQDHVKKQKSSEEAPEMEKSTEEITEEKMKEMMQLVPVEDVYVQALQVKHPIIDWKVHTEGQRSYWKIIRVEIIRSKWSASCDCQRQRNLHASRKGLSYQKRFSTCDDQLQASVTVKCNIMYKDFLYYKKSPLVLVDGIQVSNEPASLVRDVSEGEACLTDSGFIASQDRVTIAKSYTLPRDSVPRITSPAADEGSMQQPISELTALCTSLQWQHS